MHAGTASHPLSADRNILVDQPKDGIFAVFGDARHKIEGGQVVLSREMYLRSIRLWPKTSAGKGYFDRIPRISSTWSSSMSATGVARVTKVHGA